MGKRIAERLAALGWRQGDLVARVPGLSVGTLSALVNRDSIRSEFSGPIAQALGVQHDWLTRGTGPMTPPGVSAELQPLRPTVSVPLLSWREVAAMLESGVATDQPESGRWLPVTHARPGTGSFSVVLESDAMTAPGGAEPTFPRGTVLVCDPGRAPVPGDFVIAADPVTGQPTFKRLASDAGRWFLVPLNPAYPSSPLASLDGAILAVVCEVQLTRTY
jgi:SOS-response transcriptional repressor LexA